MKHIFVVHSNITYLAALGVVCKESLPLEDVVIVSDHYEREAPVKVHLIDIVQPLRLFWKHLQKCLRPVKYATKIIDKLSNKEPFVLYVTVFFNLQRICAAHPKCTEFHFIEEGLSAYSMNTPMHIILAYIRGNQTLQSKNTWLNFLSDLLRLLRGYNLKMQCLPFLYTGFLNTSGIRYYGVDAQSFYGVKQVSVIELSAINQYFSFPKNYSFDNAHIWIGTNSVADQTLSLGGYMRAIEHGMIQRLVAQKVSRIYVKFHPYECKTSKAATLNLFQKNQIEVEVLPNSVIMETELIGSKHTTLWGVESSLLFYGTKLGVTCISIVDSLDEPYARGDIPALWNSVTVV